MLSEAAKKVVRFMLDNRDSAIIRWEEEPYAWLYERGPYRSCKDYCDCRVKNVLSRTLRELKQHGLLVWPGDPENPAYRLDREAAAKALQESEGDDAE